MIRTKIIPGILLGLCLLLQACGGEPAHTDAGTHIPADSAGPSASPPDHERQGRDSADRPADANWPPNLMMAHMTLYQPDAELAENLEDPDAFVEWSARIQHGLVAGLKDMSGAPAAMSLVVAVNTDERVQHWIIEHQGQVNAATRDLIASVIGGEEPPQVRKSVAAFAICANLFGGDMEKTAFPAAPLPEDWKAVRDSFGGEPVPVSVLIEGVF